MFTLLASLLFSVPGCFRTRVALHAEILALTPSRCEVMRLYTCDVLKVHPAKPFLRAVCDLVAL